MEAFTFTKGADWNSTQAYGIGGSIQLPKGGYVCRIKNAKCDKNSGGNDIIAIAFDITEGEYKGFFENRFQTRKQNDANTKWGAVYRQRMYNNDGSTNPFFKGLITVIEKSNNVIFDDLFTESDLKGKVFGVIFGREEFRTQDGRTAWAVKPVSLRTADVIRNGDFEIPNDKPLIEAQAANPHTAYITANHDEDLPF